MSLLDGDRCTSTRPQSGPGSACPTSRDRQVLHFRQAALSYRATNNLPQTPSILSQQFDDIHWPQNCLVVLISEVVPGRQFLLMRSAKFALQKPASNSVRAQVSVVGLNGIAGAELQSRPPVISKWNHKVLEPSLRNDK
jgi:hypothetical protein